MASVSTKKIDPIEIPYDFCGHQVPGIWRYLLPKEALEWKLPRESRSTCDDCPMACFHNYHPTYRCCAYHPIVPNFLLGLSLRNKTSTTAVKSLIKSGFLTPEGFQRTPSQWIDYLADLSEDSPPDEMRVLCPILDKSSGLCNIYAFRNAVCSTFFCLNDHGDRGQQFWEALEETVSHAESALTQWALSELGFDLKKYYKRLDKYAKAPLTVMDPKTRGWKESVRKDLWGKHYGKELQLLKACGDLIAENRDRLWEIASKQEVMEASKFEKAQVRAVPKAYEDEIDPDDLEDTEEGESASLQELFDEAKKEYKKMWKVPSRVVLNPRAKIEPNPQDDKESKAFKNMPYVLKYLKKQGGKKYEWRQFISQETADALTLMKKPKKADKISEKAPFKKIEEPEVFLAQWSSKKVLIKPNY